MKDPISTCTICPNGCPLFVNPQKDDRLKAMGHQCIQGFSYLKKLLPAELRMKLFNGEKQKIYPKEFLEELTGHWGIGSIKSIEYHSIQGSPERSFFRCRISAGDKTFLLEELEFSQLENRLKIAKRLEKLQRHSVAVPIIFKTKDGNKILQLNDSTGWQLSLYYKGETLNRKNFWKDSSKGECLAQELLKVYQSGINSEKNEVPFLLEDFLFDLWTKLEARQPESWNDLKSVVSSLEKNLIPFLKNSPMHFSHGDPHPLNVIWGKEGIIAIIDWEFSGFKNILYDISLVMGCVGSESPEAFTSQFNRQLYKTFETSAYYSTKELSMIPHMVLGQRFAWLNEWLRHSDREMLDQEIFYMNYLLNHHIE